MDVGGDLTASRINSQLWNGGLLMVLKGAEKTAARLSHWTYAEIHLFCACSLTALLVRTKSFLYHIEYVFVQLLYFKSQNV